MIYNENRLGTFLSPRWCHVTAATPDHHVLIVAMLTCFAAHSVHSIQAGRGSEALPGVVAT